MLTYATYFLLLYVIFQVAYSGIGVMCNWDYCGDIHLKDRWLDTLGGRRGDLAWDHASFRPDAVVLTVGENDLCCGRINNPKMVADFENAYTEFVRYLFKVYDKPHIHFFLAVGPLADYYQNPIRRVVDRLRQEHISASYLDIMVAGMGYPYGCNYHPSVVMNEKIFEKARAQIVQELGWSTGGEGDGVIRDKSGRRLRYQR